MAYSTSTTGIQHYAFVIVVSNLEEVSFNLAELIPEHWSIHPGEESLSIFAKQIMDGPDDRIPDDGGDRVLCARVEFSTSSGWTIDFDRITL